MKIDFQDGRHGGHLGFPIRTILLFFFYLKVTPMLPTKFQVNWPFGSGEEASNWNDLSYFWSTSHPDDSYQVSSQLAFRFRTGSKNIYFQIPWWPSWIPNRKDYCYFWSTSYPNASYQVSSQLAFPFRRRNEKKIFKMAWQPSWISNWNDFSYFWFTSHPNASYQVSSQLALWFRKRSEKKIFKMASMAANLDFRSEWFIWSEQF